MIRLLIIVQIHIVRNIIEKIRLKEIFVFPNIYYYEHNILYNFCLHPH